jgi:molybdopterin converting factor small subunit
LQDLLEIWGLRREDVAEIEKEVLGKSEQDSKIRQENEKVLQSEEEKEQTDNLKELEDKMVRELLSRSSKERSARKKILFYLLVILTIVIILLINYVLFGDNRTAYRIDDKKPAMNPVADMLPTKASPQPLYPSNQLFVIRLSSDETLSESENEVNRIQPLALRNRLTVQRFKINGWFVTTVGYFSSVQEANNFRDTILSEIEHFKTTGTTVENIKDLCPNPLKNDKYWECLKK